MVTIPGETTVPCGSGVEAEPKLVPGGNCEAAPKPDPGAVLGIGISGIDMAFCDAGDDVGGCRHEYGTSGGDGEAGTGEGMGRGMLFVPGPEGIGRATGKLPAGPKAKVLSPTEENKPARWILGSTGRSSSKGIGRPRLAAGAESALSAAAGLDRGVSTGG
jgi:hypothetical protein